MGAKFIIDRRCPVKTSLTLSGLIEAIKHRSLLRRIGEMEAAGALPAMDEDVRLDVLLPPELGLPAGLTLRELQMQAERLMSFRSTCRMCPSSLNGHVGGCIAYVPYPLSDGIEYLLWVTAVKALKRELPGSLLPEARAFAEAAAEVRQTLFADGMRRRGDILSAATRHHQDGPIWRRVRLSSAQVLDRFFLGGMLTGDELKAHAGFLDAALALGGALEQKVAGDEERAALREDLAAYREVRDLMRAALEQDLGVYIWP